MRRRNLPGGLGISFAGGLGCARGLMMGLNMDGGSTTAQSVVVGVVVVVVGGGTLKQRSSLGGTE